MKLVQVGSGDVVGSTLASFRCSTGESYEDEVERWINRYAIAWANDVPRARFQRRVLTVAKAGSDAVGVVAWQDITRVDLDGIWLEVLAINGDLQRRGSGQRLLQLISEHLRAIDRDGDHLAGLVHPDNLRCKRLLTSAGWTQVTTMDQHELWLGSI